MPAWSLALTFLRRTGTEPTVTLHTRSAWEHFTSGQDSAAELIKQLLAIVVRERTLAMPAVPYYAMQSRSWGRCSMSSARHLPAGCCRRCFAAIPACRPASICTTPFALSDPMLTF